MRIYLFALITLLAREAWSIPVESFREKIIAHRLNVREDMVRLLRQYPNTFSHIDEPMVREYAQYHDLPKLQTLKSLKDFNYGGEKNISEVLARYYGLNGAELEGPRGELLKRTVAELNRVENLQKEIFFGQLRVEAPLTAESAIRELKLIEHVSDVVDVGVSRTAEFGGAVLGSEYLVEVEEGAPFVVRMALFLEETVLPFAESAVADVAMGAALM
jgi:hypothetical protein